MSTPNALQYQLQTPDLCTSWVCLYLTEASSKASILSTEKITDLTMPRVVENQLEKYKTDPMFKQLQTESEASIYFLIQLKLVKLPFYVCRNFIGSCNHRQYK
jgi:hypothetical protein